MAWIKNIHTILCYDLNVFDITRKPPSSMKHEENHLWRCDEENA